MAGDDSGTKVPYSDPGELPQHDYDEVAMDKGGNLGKNVALKITPPTASESDDVSMLYVYSTWLMLSNIIENPSY